MLGRLRVAVLLAWPSLALLGLVAIPVVLLLRISLAPPDPNGLWSAGATFDAYRGLMDRSFAAALLYSLGLAILVAAVGVGLGFPLTFFITRMRPGWQVLWPLFFFPPLPLVALPVAFFWPVHVCTRHA